MLELTLPNARQLRSQLDDYQRIIEANQELFDKNVPAREELAAKFRAAQILLDRLEKYWERVDRILILDDANQLVTEIRAGIEVMLSQDIS